MSLVEKTTGRFASFDGTEIYYETRGNGDPIIFVYGIACLMNHWHFQTEALSKKFKTITIDLRAHHLSKVPQDKSNLSVVSCGRDLIELCKHLNIKKAHFVGHSFGAQVILAAYQHNAEFFKSIALINGFAKNPIKGMFGLDVIEPFFHFIKAQYAKNPPLWDLLWKTSIDNPLSMWVSALAGGFNIQHSHFKDIEIYARGVSQIPLSVFLPMFENMMDFKGESVAEKVACPTMIISGDRDFITPQKFQIELHNKIKGSAFVNVPYGSHCSQLDFPDYVNLRLEKFFEST